MTKADEISHLSDVIRGAVNNFSDSMEGRFGYLARLRRVAERGGYATPETTEAIRLEMDAAALRKLAEEMLLTRAALLSNQPQLLIAAE